MSQPFSPVLTELPGTYSGGQFETDSETPCNRIPSFNTLDEEEDPFDHMQVVVFHGLEISTPRFCTTDNPRAFTLRILCHWLIDQIDKKGLEDVLASLAEFYDYYRPIEHTPELTCVVSKPASIGSRSVSPPFLIEEE